MGRYRFPGLRAFDETEAAIFNGRAKEKQALFDLIMVERSVVMFAKSGAGKSSLLRAGIVPMLANVPYEPVYIRLERTEEPLLQQVCRKISQVFGVSYQTGQTLWEYLHKVDIHSGNETPILMFDQFEELFTLYPYSQRQMLIGQLADVINGTLPKSVHTQLITQTSLDENSNWVTIEKPPRSKFVFAIRSDLLSYLHELSDSIPGILRNRYELRGLHPDQAAEAIVLPAAVVGDEYQCPPFEVHPEALREILECLSVHQSVYNTEAPEIESFQLQLVCKHLEEKVLELHRQGVQPLLVTVDVYGGQAGIEHLLSAFYIDTLQAIPDETQRHNAQVIIEDELIKNKRRVSVAEASILEGEHALSANTLELLVEKRLLRKDERPGLGKYYELAHDTLLTPILFHGQERRINEAAEKKQEERQGKLKKWGLSILGIGLVLIACAAIYYANLQKNRAQFSYLLAESKLLAVQDNTRSFRLASAARVLEPDNTEAVGSMIHAFYGDLFQLEDILYAAPKYREYAALWVKAVPGSSKILMLQPGGDTLLIVDPPTQTSQKLAVKGKPKDAALSPDGRWLLTVLRDDSVRLTQLLDNTRNAQMLPHKALSVAISPDGQFFTTNCFDGKQRLWSSDSKVVLREFKNEAEIDLVKQQVAFSPDCKQILVLNDGSTAQLFTLSTAKSVLLKAKGVIQYAAYSANGQYLSLLVTSGRKQRVYLFNQQGQELAYQELDSELDNILSVTPTQEGNSILLTGKTNQISLISREGKSQVLASVELLDPNERSITAFSQGERVLAYNFGNEIIHIMDAKKKVDIYSLQHLERVADLFFCADQRFLVVQTTADKVRVWDLKSCPIDQNFVKNKPVIYAFFKPGSTEIIMQDRSSTWSCDGATEKCLPTWLTDSVRHAVPWGDDQTVLIQDAKGNLNRINIQTGISIPIKTLKQAASRPPVVAGGIIALDIYQGNNTFIQVLQSNGTEIAQMPVGAKVNALDLSPDGRKLALALSDSTVVIRMLSDSDQDTVRFDRPVQSLAFAPDGNSLLIGGKGKVYRWRINSQQPTAFLLYQHEEDTDITAIAWSPDGQMIATSDVDQNVVLWNATGRWLHTFVIPKVYRSANRLQFSSDGRLLLTQHLNAVFRWPLDPDELIRKMNDAQFLSPEERQLFNLK